MGAMDVYQKTQSYISMVFCRISGSRHNYVHNLTCFLRSCIARACISVEAWSLKLDDRRLLEHSTYCTLSYS